MKNTTKWSESLIKQTYKMLKYKEFAPVSDKIYLKHIEGKYATLSLENLVSNNFILEDADTGEQTIFQTVEELVEAGWAVD